jgi:1-acyl-sn-glycerol-3-phosphate acyltransferase
MKSLSALRPRYRYDTGLIQSLLRLVQDPEVARAIDANPTALNELGYDPWGYHPEHAKGLYSIAKQAYRYFRPTVYGIENLPPGRVLIIGNHSGQLPFDGIILAMACLLNAHPPRLVRAMAERWFPTIPFVNEAFVRCGVVVGDPINCRNLLEADNAILVFPEGARGCGKPWRQRYRLTEFGRGFMRLALQTSSPILPVAIVGAEESIPSVTNLKSLARLVGAPYVPVPALLPLLGPLAFLPLPTRFYFHFGEPMYFDGPFDDEDEVIEQKVQAVKERLQAMIDIGVRQRPAIF